MRSAILSFAAPLLPEIIEFFKPSSKIEQVSLWRPLWRRQEVDNYGVSRSSTFMKYQTYIDGGERWFVASQRTWRRGMMRFWVTCTKIVVFSLEFVSTRKSTTKPFQDHPFWWQPHQKHIKAFCDFKMHMSCTLARVGPSPVLTFCCWFHPDHADCKVTRSILLLLSAL